MSQTEARTAAAGAPAGANTDAALSKQLAGTKITSSETSNGNGAAAAAQAASAAASSATADAAKSASGAQSDLPDADTVARQRKDWFIPASLASKRTLNPIRAIVDKLVIPLNSGKTLIPLSIGDPTVFGNLQPPPTALAELTRLLFEGKSNGYAPSTGTVAARTAIATRYSPAGCKPLTAGDVMICSGASGALHILMDAMLQSGDNILLPKPGFSLYATIAGYLGAEVRYYDLLPDQSWECDLAQMATLVDHRTRALLINNPSNPNGSNFSAAHLHKILEFAREHKLPIVSDEIYADMVFAGQVFTPIASLAEPYGVPVVAVGGIAKQFVVPGWRIGWLLFHDIDGRLAEVKAGALALTQVILGSNTLCQALLPNLLLHTPAEYYTTLNSVLEDQSVFLYTRINAIPGGGLQAIEPQGAMYLMVRINTGVFDETGGDDVAFSAALLQEELLFVLPGSCFLAPNFIRLVTCAPKHIMEQAVNRLERFCKNHYREGGAAAAAAAAANAIAK